MQVTRVAIRRPVTVWMAVTACVLFGIVSLERLPLNLLPEISYPSLTVQTDYTDAAPEEVETLLTRPVEEAVGVVSGLHRISSVSRPGQSEVVLEFTWSVDMDIAAIEVREKLDLIELPREARRPVILRFDPSNEPILRVQMHGGLTLSRLRDLAEREVKNRLESVEGVAAVKVVGGREEEIHIEIDERRLAELGIPITRVTDIVRQENLNRASGSLYDLDRNYMVRMVNEFRSVEEVRGIVVDERTGRTILMSDVARVWRGSKERAVIARFNGSESVELAVYKEGDANTVSVSRAVASRLERMREEPTYPQGLETTTVFDQAGFITMSINNVLAAAVAGGILATLVLFVFLRNGRSTAVIAVSIPISIMATFAAMHQFGITLNIMSLGGIALGIGMLVDNAIVVLEAVHRHRSPQRSLAEAVYEGTSEVAMPVTASTATTVAVFLPLVFVEGIAGQLFRDQALTITFSLVASLAVALTVIPMLLALRIRPPRRSVRGPATEGWTNRFGRMGHAVNSAARFAALTAPRVVAGDARRFAVWASSGLMGRLEPRLNTFDRALARLSERYAGVLARALDRRLAVVAVVLGCLAGSVAVAVVLGAELIPPLSQGEFSFEIELPDSRPLEATDRVMQRVEEAVAAMPEVASVFATVGGSRDRQFASGDLEENVGMLHVSVQGTNRGAAEDRVIAALRGIIAAIPEAEATLMRPALFSFKTPIEVEVFAYSLEDQKSATELIADRMARIDGLRDVETTTRAGSPEIQIRFDRRRLNQLGLQEQQVARILQNKIRGDVASRYREGDRLIDILVRVDRPDRDAIADIGGLVINSEAGRGRATQQDAGGEPGESPQEESPAPQRDRREARGSREAAREPSPFVPIRLSQVAEIEIARGPAEIRRIRSQRAAVVRADLTGRDLGGASEDIRTMLLELRDELPVATVVGLGGQNEELQVSFRSLGFALSLAVFLVYLVMASQFESLIHPFVILLTVPLGLVGSVLLLALTGGNLNVLVLLGAIVLAGIAVNNGIVLVDYTNRLRTEGLARRQALLQAGQVRLRPILMTSLTTLLGLLPMAFGWGEGSELRTPMAVAVIGGLLTTTPFTLIVIPVVYDLVDRKRFAPVGEGSGPVIRPDGRAFPTPLGQV